MAAYMGLRATKDLDQISFNLANASTIAFKQEKVFLWCLQNQPDQNTGAKSPAAYVDVFSRDYSQGGLQATDNENDLAIDGYGFFKVETPGGLRYTRNGAFTLNANRELVTKEGYKVMGKNGPLTLDSRDQKFAVDNEGGIHLDNTLSDQLAVVDFPNPQGLQLVGHNYYLPRAEAGEEMEAQNYRVMQGKIELSNVDPVEESVNLINVQRAFEAYTKIMDTYSNSDRKIIEEIGR
jgi:flagellar basal-body rod protein FlgG